MPRVCTVCASEHRDSIDARAAVGASMSALAREFGVGERAVQRHVAGHLSERLREASARSDRFTAAALVARLGELLDSLEAARRSAVDRDDERALLAAIDREFRILESVGSKIAADTGVEVSTASINDYEILRGAVVHVVSDRPLFMLSLRSWLSSNGSEGARLADDIDTEAKAARARNAISSPSTTTPGATP